ncbi:MAG: hypothetical protein GXP25_07040 [Planctomycetes bacterium]|nr:hypothetical protein [Planctomycetota bacterium]
MLRHPAIFVLMVVTCGTLAADMVLEIRPRHSGQNVPCSIRIKKVLSPSLVCLVNETGAVIGQFDSGEGHVEEVLRWVEPSVEKDKPFTRRVSALKDTPGPGVQLRKGEAKVEVTINNKPFTCYNFSRAAPKPYCWPVMAPTGKPITRAYPMIKDVPGEQHDHHHHRSWFFTFGSVNGTNFWSETEKSGFTRHVKFDRLVSGPVFGEIVARNNWVTRAGKKELEDVRTYRFYNVKDGFLVDWNVVLLATEGPVKMGDTKEGMASFRVATSMIQKNGGTLTNSEGDVDGKCWGKRAKWCDVSGKVDGVTVGVALFDHPTSFRHPTYWHARTYGLFGANPFGYSYFLHDKTKDGSYTIAKGDKLRFTYRVYIHRGDAADAKVAEKYINYAEPPVVTIVHQ